jgi:hypothetical protein
MTPKAEIVTTFLALVSLTKLLWVCGIIVSVGGAVGVCYGMIRWIGVMYEKSSEAFRNIMSIEEMKVTLVESAKMVAETKLGVDAIETNHLRHIEDALIDEKKYHEEQILLSREIRDGIIKLVDRGERKD